ncbi:hypothetical protein LWE61_01995 [Sphingobium sufflavum]|uniref:hypothetical protein n=1 Tax=Sphingobium sufflavum TaxID=1129547 RepID=UPI001F33EBB1|nr:hypothetical protein [Sphingobium sufflavum]MCE7795324.1 hypothetical protein [Sphingobium sufflavum]
MNLKAIFGSDDTDMGLAIALLPFAMLIAVGMFLTFGRRSAPPPARAWTGCFVSTGSPSVKFDGTQLSFAQTGMASMRYRMALQKYGTIAIETDPAVRLVRQRDRTLRFALRNDGPTYAMRLVHVVEGKAYGVHKL